MPTHLRARVYGVVGAAAWAVMPVGSLLAGVAVERAGLTTTLVVCGVAYLLVSLVPLLGRAWAGTDRRGRPPGSAAS